jgi:tetratricopeptide (TPR) repeat protein
MKTKKSFVIFTLLAMLMGAGTVVGAGTTAAKTEMDLFSDLDVALEHQQDQTYGQDSAQCVRNWSLYAEYYRQRNYDMAYEPWKYMFEDCPRATLNIYIHGANMIKYFYNNETDPNLRDSWVDSLMFLYDRRIEMFGEEGRVLGRKAADLYQLRPTDVQELYELSERSIELEGMNSGADVLLINFQAIIRLADAALLEPEAIIEAFDRATDIIEYNLEHNSEDARYYNPAKNNIRSMFEPYATCESLAQVFGPRFDANPEDVELLQRITEMLENAGCTNDELFYHATLQLHNIHPDAESAFLMGRLENTRENYRRAIEFFQEAADLYIEEGMAQNKDRIFRAYWLMAEISYRQFRELPQARGYARQAHQTIPDDGRPLILIGEMYAASASECGDDDVSKKAAYWAAVDKFNEAQNVASDEIIKERAQQMVETYRLYFPNNEEIFFHGYTEGETFRVECWINRTTRIRAR